MSAFEIYTLIISLFIYLLFVALFSTFVIMITKSYIKQMAAGLEDEQIVKEYQEELHKQNKPEIFGKIIPVLFCVILSVLFVFSAYSALTQNERVGKLPTVKAVSSGSMSMKFSENKYLFENNVDNQIQTFDLIVLHELPKEEDLKLYDIVVYEVGGSLLVHRIVAIEEPNGEHPDERHFLLQGDNVQYPDKFPVRYSQMKSIYRNERIPFIGSFVFFMQSPAGVLCFLLVVASVISMSILEKKVLQARDARLAILFAQKAENESAVALAIEEETEALAEVEQADLEKADYYANAKRLTFDEKAALLCAERKAWLDGLIAAARSISGVVEQKGKNGITYRRKGKPIAKVKISRKHVYVYLAVAPTEYAGKKAYGAKDVSLVKAYALYPTRIKLTSNRKLTCAQRIFAEKFGAQK